MSEARIFVVDKGKALSIEAPGLIPPAPAQADEANRSARAAAVETTPAHGKLVVKSDGSFIYTPERSFTGTDTFTYKVTVGTATTPGTATIIVR
jgi:VCBS repeat-containing protein